MVKYHVFTEIESEPWPEYIAKLLFDWFAIDLTALEGCWLAVDGKDLRGSIQTGQTRGQACVSVVNQTTEAVLGQAYYSGKKESEKLVVRQLLVDTGLTNQQLSLDTLHGTGHPA